MNQSSSPRLHVLSHATLYSLLLIFTAFPVLFQPSPATFHSLDSHWMENSWFGDCPEHIMPNSSVNPHLPLLSSELPRSLSSFKVGLHSWNKRKTAFMRTCSSPTYGTALPLLLSLTLFPNTTPQWDTGVMASSAFDDLKQIKQAEPGGWEGMELTGIQGQIPGVVHLLFWIDAATWAEIANKSVFDGVTAVWNVYVSETLWGRRIRLPAFPKFCNNPASKSILHVHGKPG